MGKIGDPQTGWMKEEFLEQAGCSFQVDNCIVSDLAVPKVVSRIWIIKGAFGLSRVRILGLRASAFPIRGIQDLR